MKKIILVLWVFLGFVSLLFPEYAQENKTVSLPVTKIVLYKNGLGYFEHQGQVKDNAEVNLTFKQDQMKDLLTSFYAIDLNGGKISNISYDSKEPLSKELEDILLHLSPDHALTEFVKELVGAQIKLKVGSEEITGKVLGIEPIKKESEHGITTTYKIVLARDEGTIEAHDLLELSSLQLLDKPLQKDLKRALDIYLRAKYKDRKTVRVYAQGKGERDVQLGYLIETPVWKTSYRLLFQEKGKKPILQGWSMIENTTDYDWDKVQLSLVAGNPIAFVLDLYTSFTPARQVIDIQSLFPSVHLEGLEAPPPAPRIYPPSFEAEASESESPIQMDSLKSPGSNSYMQGRAMMRKDLSQSLARSVEAAAQGVQVGDLFSYNLESPVSIPQGKSALVPILAQPVGGDKVLYYKEEMSRYPLNSFYLTNSSNLTLDSGPVTFFQESTSLGEGLLKRVLKPGMKELLPYAIETGVEINKTGNGINQPIYKITIANGVLYAKQYYILETTYNILNKTGKEYTLYIDQPKASGDYRGIYHLLSPSKPYEEFETYYRFKVAVSAQKEPQVFKVQERMDITSTLYVQNTQVSQLEVYLQESALSESSRQFLKEVIDLMKQLGQLQREEEGEQEESKQLVEDQARFRQNMEALHDTPSERELRSRYIKQLEKAEDRLGTLRVSIQQSEEKQRTLQSQLSQKIQSYQEKD